MSFLEIRTGASADNVLGLKDEGPAVVLLVVGAEVNGGGGKCTPDNEARIKEED